jgi:hypothetical protein
MWFTTPVTGFVLMIAMTQSKYATIKSKAQLKKKSHAGGFGGTWSGEGRTRVMLEMDACCGRLKQQQ